MLGIAVKELLEDLRGAVDAGALPAVDVDYLAAAMAGVDFEVAARMADRRPVDVEGAAAFATAPLPGRIARLGAGGC